MDVRTPAIQNPAETLPATCPRRARGCRDCRAPLPRVAAVVATRPADASQPVGRLDDRHVVSDVRAQSVVRRPTSAIRVARTASGSAIASPGARDLERRDRRVRRRVETPSGVGPDRACDPQVEPRLQAATRSQARSSQASHGRSRRRPAVASARVCRPGGGTSRRRSVPASARAVARGARMRTAAQSAATMMKRGGICHRIGPRPEKFAPHARRKVRRARYPRTTRS